MSGHNQRIVINQSSIDSNIFVDIINRLLNQSGGFSIYVDDMLPCNEVWRIERRALDDDIIIRLIGHSVEFGIYGAGTMIVNMCAITGMIKGLTEIFISKTQDFICERD